MRDLCILRAFYLVTVSGPCYWLAALRYSSAWWSSFSDSLHFNPGNSCFRSLQNVLGSSLSGPFMLSDLEQCTVSRIHSSLINLHHWVQKTTYLSAAIMAVVEISALLEQWSFNEELDLLPVSDDGELFLNDEKRCLRWPLRGGVLHFLSVSCLLRVFMLSPAFWQFACLPLFVFFFRFLLYRPSRDSALSLRSSIKACWF